MTLTRTAADELWSTGRGRGLGSKSWAGGHPRAPPEAADDVSWPRSWTWNGSANGEAGEAQAVAPLAGQFVILPDWTVQYGERYHHTSAWLRAGWVGTGDWQCEALEALRYSALAPFSFAGKLLAPREYRMQSAWRIVSVLELLKVARHADCWTLPRAVKGASNASLTAASRQRGSSSPVVCIVPAPPLASMPGPKASTSLLLRPMSRATFPAILGPPPWCSGGEPFLVVLQGTSQWCHTPLSHPLLPDKIEGISVVRSSSPIQPSVRDRASWDSFPRKKEEGSFVKLGQEPSTGFFLLELECFYTCPAHNKTSCESHSAGRCFFGGAVIAPRQTWARLPTD
ncbi:uncharacterized protein K444DRAFT_666874 [Hyaloscypha bicolor E]|uniref:Uncharacterized protein n=1 Tax=Hyaloscypha bicolor E TaxID=1095630 RepID=A0A2J6SVX9_9HELO|nr:uncharacterized protein K444DRAFT_666874 [Hyaloscypha bicolor E]PMD54931.1 hypothetical protein K444DRAFT_666874 [Hyaloscypha bicolor E]